MRPVWIPGCLASVLWLLAGIASAQPVRDSDYLRHYPSPQQVRADIAADAGNTKPQELEGRIAGRLKLLEGTLFNTYSRNGGYPRGFEQAPAKAVQLHDAYSREYGGLVSRMRKLQIRDGAGCNDRSQNDAGECVYWNFQDASDAYESGLDQTRAVMGLYFPKRYHERFLDRSPYAFRIRIEAEREAKQARAEAEKAEEAEARTGSLAGAIGGLVFLLFSLGIAFVGFRLLLKAGRMGHAVGRYEFENRTDGGVVQFESYEDVKRHKLRREGSGCLGSTGLALLVVGGLMSFVAFLVVFRALFA